MGKVPDDLFHVRIYNYPLRGKVLLVHVHFLLSYKNTQLISIVRRGTCICPLCLFFI
jgi:hypothetical protein